ncbi:MAG: aminotransferase class III-fold pyridoxal phosphate-dependent enzyme [Planctomycetia bacterium]|nr:aminotransferase class III-fold pyridoxal phosphate-dependent enzyme [Planctomycetia bacterium]
MTDNADRFLIARGENDRLFDEAGRAYIDLFSAHGAAWLGHANPVVGDAIAKQLRQIWNTGAISTPIREQAQAAVESLFPPSHRLAGFYSTGMEAAEFVSRMARVATGRKKIVGFEHSMHGKSLATAALGWGNDWNLDAPELMRLPFVDQADEMDIVASFDDVLRERNVAAVLVEPLLGSHGGYEARAAFYRTLAKMCREYGTLLVFDEILTGFGRTGANFYFQSVDILPDVVLIGKALGAGFPVSGVVVNRSIAIEPGMLPGSTFAGNALACAAVAATLNELNAINVVARVIAIAEIIERELAPLRELGVGLRGRGALWVLELPDHVEMKRLLAQVYRRGVAIGSNGRFVRLLPAVTIELEHLGQACRVLVETIHEQLAIHHG